MIATVIGLLIAGQIAAIVVGILRGRQNKYNDNTKVFAVKPDSLAVLILLGCSVLFMLPAVPASLSSAEYNKDVWIFFLGLGLPFFVLAIALSFSPKIYVNKDSIRVKSFLSSRVYKFSDITHYSASDDTTFVYRQNKKLFSFDIDSIGSKNMFKRLEQEGVQRMEGSEIKTICKADIGSLKESSTARVLFFIAWYVFFALSLYGLIHNGVGEFITYNVIGLVFGVVLAGGLLFYYRSKCRGFITGLEKTLDISFDAEMKRLGIGSFRYRDRDWYGVSWNMWKLMVRRDYISRLISIEEDTRSRCETVTIETVDGKRFSFKEGLNSGFADWWRYR